MPRSIVSGEASRVVCDPVAVAALRAKPAVMIYGMRDRVLLPEFFIPAFAAAFPQAQVHRLARAGHFLQEDEPEAVAALVGQFCTLT